MTPEARLCLIDAIDEEALLRSEIRGLEMAGEDTRPTWHLLRTVQRIIRFLSEVS